MSQKNLNTLVDEWMYPRMFLTRYSEAKLIKARLDFIQYMREQGVTNETDESLMQLFENARKNNPF